MPGDSPPPIVVQMSNGHFYEAKQSELGLEFKKCEPTIIAPEANVPGLPPDKKLWTPAQPNHWQEEKTKYEAKIAELEQKLDDTEHKLHTEKFSHEVTRSNWKSAMDSYKKEEDKAQMMLYAFMATMHATVVNLICEEASYRPGDMERKVEDNALQIDTNSACAVMEISTTLYQTMIPNQPTAADWFAKFMSAVIATVMKRLDAPSVEEAYQQSLRNGTPSTDMSYFAKIFVRGGKDMWGNVTRPEVLGEVYANMLLYKMLKKLIQIEEQNVQSTSQSPSGNSEEHNTPAGNLVSRGTRTTERHSSQSH